MCKSLGVLGVVLWCAPLPPDPLTPVQREQAKDREPEGPLVAMKAFAWWDDGIEEDVKALA